MEYDLFIKSFDTSPVFQLLSFQYHYMIFETGYIIRLTSDIYYVKQELNLLK